MDRLISGTKVFLRFMTVDDTDDIVRWRNSDRVRGNFIYQTLFTREGHLEWTKKYVDTGHVIQFMICDINTEKAIGCVNFKDIDETHKKAEYGIFIGEDEAVGKGIGTEVANLAVHYAFEQLKLHKIILRVLPHNKAAIRSYEKAGFVQEAYLKDEVCINGVFQDLILMGIINPNDK